MANSILTPTAVTRAAAVILHEKLKFVNSINMQYDAQYAIGGQKSGGSIKIRMPNEYTVRTGAVMDVQDTPEISETLTIATQKGVDLNFSSADLALSIEDFSARILDPAMASLAASIEADAVGLIDDVRQFVDHDAAALEFKDIMKAKQKLDEHLTPDDVSRRSLFVSPSHNTTLVDALKSLLIPTSVGDQLKSGKLGTLAGVGDVYVSSHITDHTTGTAAKNGEYTVNGATEGADGAVTLQTGSTTFKKGDRVTFAGCYDVHPETKVAYSYLKQFVVTEDYAGGAGDLKIAPSIVTSGARQNVSAYPDNSGAVVKLGAGASEKTNRSVMFHRDAFAIAFADLPDMSEFGAWCARKVIDGISVRVWRQGDILNDKVPCRLDVLYGLKTIRPQMACVIHADA